MSSVVRAKFRAATIAACAIGIAALLAGPADAAAKRPAYLGTWGLSVPDCRTGGAILEITRTTWGEVDSECSLRSIKGGNGVWVASIANCRGDGVKKMSKVTVWANATRLTLLHAGTKFRSNFTRCQ